MKVEIQAHVEFSAHDEHDLYVAVLVDNDSFLTRQVKFDDILRRQLKNLSKDERKDFKAQIAKSLKSFLAKLEK